MRKFTVQIKEKGNPRVLHTTYTGPNTTTIDKVIEHFGLNEPDVVWYNIEASFE